MKEPESMPALQEINEEAKECTKNEKIPDDETPKKVSWKQESLDLISELETNNLMETSSDLTKKIEDIKKTINLTFQEIKEIKEEKHKHGAIKEESLKESYILKLYKQISKLQFDLGSAEEELQGVVATTHPKTFHLNTKEHSQHYIVNRLWDLIEGDDETT